MSGLYATTTMSHGSRKHSKIQWRATCRRGRGHKVSRLLSPAPRRSGRFGRMPNAPTTDFHLPSHIRVPGKYDGHILNGKRGDNTIRTNLGRFSSIYSGVEFEKFNTETRETRVCPPAEIQTDDTMCRAWRFARGRRRRRLTP